MKIVLEIVRPILFVFFLFSISVIANAQIDSGEQPPSFKNNKRGALQLPVINLNDVGILEPDNNVLSGKNKKLVFADVFQTDISPNNNGEWNIFDDGSRVWQLQIVSKGALSLNYTLDFMLPDDAKLFVYTPDKKYMAGAFTSLNNKTTGILNIAPVPGDTTIFEYFMPKEAIFKDDFTIKRIGHDFLGVLNNNKSGHEQSSGYCNVDISCPEAVSWQLEKNAVCKLIINNKELCTGTMINNLKDNGKPYLITAKHCISNYYDANNTLFLFNYESIGCGGEETPFYNSLSGSELKAFSFKLDFSLVELSKEPPESYHPYYAGWDIENKEPLRSVCIHHPGGDVKKISEDRNTAVTDDYGAEMRPYSHWRILEWEVGTTEKGSSGAPLFDQNHRLVGILSGGEANCSSSINDYFTKLYHIWDEYEAQESQTKYWLNPLNMPATSHHGMNPYILTRDNDAEVLEKNTPEYELCNIDTFRPSVIIRNKGRHALNELNVGYQINEMPPVEMKWYGNLFSNLTTTVDFDLITLPNGEYNIKYYVSNPNNMEDENVLNDTLFFDFKVSHGVELGIEVQTDNFAGETSWQLIDYNEQIIKRGTEIQNNYLMQTKACVLADCYTFKIYDKKGDGLCCEFGEGYYWLYNTANNDTILYNNKFDFIDSTYFCLTREMPEKKSGDLINSLIVYPSPGASDFKILIRDNEMQRVMLTGSEAKLEVFDILGKRVFSNRYIGEDIMFSLSDCERGAYFAVVTVDGKRFVSKFHLF